MNSTVSRPIGVTDLSNPVYSVSTSDIHYMTDQELATLEVLASNEINFRATEDLVPLIAESVADLGLQAIQALPVVRNARIGTALSSVGAAAGSAQITTDTGIELPLAVSAKARADHLAAIVTEINYEKGYRDERAARGQSVSHHVSDSAMAGEDFDGDPYNDPTRMSLSEALDELPERQNLDLYYAGQVDDNESDNPDYVTPLKLAA